MNFRIKQNCKGFKVSFFNGKNYFGWTLTLIIIVRKCKKKKKKEEEEEEGD